MALVLEIQKGRGFYLNDLKVTVEEIYSPSKFTVLVHKSGMSTIMEVNNKQQTELMPEVFAQAGRDQTSGYGDLCKIAIEAPHSIRILRDTLYDQNKAEAE